MKKLIFLTITLALALTMCSCSFLEGIIGGVIGGGGNTDVPPGGGQFPNEDPPKEDNEQYRRAADTINKLVTQQQTRLTLEIRTTKDDVQLLSYYEIDTDLDEEQVRYSVQTRGVFREEDGVILPPESFIVTHTGVGTLVDGRLVSFGGEIVNLPYVDFLKGHLWIDVNACSNFESKEDSYLGFDCNDTYQLLGCEIDSPSVRVNVEYTPDGLVWMNMTYSTFDGTSVGIYYNFN